MPNELQRASTAINAYVRWLDEHPPLVGRPLKSSGQIEELIRTTKVPTQRLVLIQQHLDAQVREAELAEGPRLKDAFVRFARTFAEHYGITPTAWRSMGIDTEVLREAGIEGLPEAKVTSQTGRGIHGPRTPLTTEHAQAVLAVWEAGGGMKRIPGTRRYSGHAAVAEHFDYDHTYVSSLITDCRRVLRGEQVRDHRGQRIPMSQTATPEPLAAHGS